MTVMERLALYGGMPVRTKKLTKRTPFDGRELELLTQVMHSQDLFAYGTNMVKRLESAICNLYSTSFAVATTSGTAALHLAVGATELNPGDEVITSPITDIGTVIPILLQNGVPIFADIAPGALHMDPNDVQRKINKRTRAIILVHLAGNPVDVEPFLQMARKYNLILIEDCCQAHATYLRGKYIGTYGHIGCFSLQQSKQITTGDGGFAITDDPVLADKMRRFTDKGRLRQPVSTVNTNETLAPNYRITALQAAVAIAQIEKVKDRVNARY
jgi:perosamine synthetase